MESPPTWRIFWLSFLGYALVDLVFHYKSLTASEWLPGVLASLVEGFFWSFLILLGIFAYSRDKKSKLQQQAQHDTDQV